MTCSDCNREKPGVCYLSADSTRCVACTGRIAGNRVDRIHQYRQIKAHQDREAAKSNWEKYWDKRPSPYIPQEWLQDWVKDMRALVPHLLRDLS